MVRMVHLSTSLFFGWTISLKLGLKLSIQTEGFTLVLCRMVQMRAAGLTAIQTYVEWSSHQPEPNQASDTLLYALLTFKRNNVYLGGLACR